MKVVQSVPHSTLMDPFSSTCTLDWTLLENIGNLFFARPIDLYFIQKQYYGGKTWIVV